MNQINRIVKLVGWSSFPNQFLYSGQSPAVPLFRTIHCNGPMLPKRAKTPKMADEDRWIEITRGFGSAFFWWSLGVRGYDQPCVPEIAGAWPSTTCRTTASSSGRPWSRKNNAGLVHTTPSHAISHLTDGFSMDDLGRLYRKAKIMFVERNWPLIDMKSLLELSYRTDQLHYWLINGLQNRQIDQWNVGHLLEAKSSWLRMGDFMEPLYPLGMKPKLLFGETWTAAMNGSKCHCYCFCIRHFGHPWWIWDDLSTVA